MSGGTRHQLRWGTQAATTKPGVRKSSDSNSSNSSNSGGGSNSGTFATAVPTYPPRNPDHVGGLSKATFGRRTRKEDRDAALLALAVLDAAPDNTLEHFVNEVVQPRFKTSMVALSVLDTDRQYFVSKIGLDCNETPIEQAFCAHAIQENRVLVVPDARQDPRFATNPLVTGDPHIRFYAGAPLVWEDGTKLGTLCILDTNPNHEFSEVEQATLAAFSSVTVHLLMGRRDRNRLILRGTEGVHGKELEEFSQTVQTQRGGDPTAALISAARAGSQFKRLDRRTLSGTVQQLSGGDDDAGTSVPLEPNLRLSRTSGSDGAATVGAGVSRKGGSDGAGAAVGMRGRSGGREGGRGRTAKRTRSLSCDDARRRRERSLSAGSAASRGCVIPTHFLRNFRKQSDLMEERLTRILRRINSTIQVDSQIKMVVTKLTDIVKSLVERSKEGKLRRTHVMAVVTELGQLLSLAPSLYVAETIREILITLVVPARALECLEYTPHEFAEWGSNSEKLQNLLTIYPPQHSLHVCRVIAQFFGVPPVLKRAELDPSHFWLAGRISARMAEDLLSKRISGTFLVRDSETTLGAHSITVRAGDHIYHFRINQLPDSKVALKAEFPFASIHELVQFHEKENIIGGVQIALKVGYKDLNSHPWYHGIISAAETNRLLMAPPNQKGAFLVRDGTPEAIRQLDDTGLMVSFRTAEEGIIHYGMKLHPKGGYTMADGPAFDTPEKLITFYSGETVGNNNASLRRALTRTRSRRLSMPLVPEVPRPKDLGYVLVGGGAGAGIAVQQVATGSAGQGFGQIGYYQQHWMKQRTAQAATGAAGGGVAHR